MAVFIDNVPIGVNEEHCFSPSGFAAGEADCVGF
uniref:Uncharacterized protein n=1 Tax=Anguilla anguilla TaxID=7936 RepID=A0A0E9VQH5_ANGAN